MTKPNRPIAFAALLLACVLPSAGFLSHGHDAGDANSDHHHCAICCLPHHGATASAAAPAAPPPEPTMRADARTRGGIGPGATLDIRPTRGPPA